MDVGLEMAMLDDVYAPWASRIPAGLRRDPSEDRFQICKIDQHA